MENIHKELCHACRHGNAKSVSVVLDKILSECPTQLAEIVDYTYSNLNGSTVLHNACARNDPDISKLLLHTAGARCDVKRIGDGNTPLHIACLFNSPEIVRYLLDCGADMLCENSKDETPVDIAAKYHHTMIESIFSEYTGGAQIKPAF